MIDAPLVPSSEAARWWPIGLALTSIAWLVVLLAGGGFTVQMGTVVFRSHRLELPALVALVTTGLAFRVRRRALLSDAAALWRPLESASRPVAIAAACFVLIAGLGWGTFAASGADSYGYVSQAALWSEATMTVRDPLAASAPWPSREWTFSPLGYRPGPERGTIVPTYPPGLPLLMAAAMKVGGLQFAYLIVPLLGAMLVLLTFRFGRMLDGDRSGMVAALLIAAAPIVLLQVVQPVSDVPAAAWWLASLVVAAGGDWRRALAAGLLAGAAVLTRPNLVPAAAAVLLTAAFDPRGLPSRARAARPDWRRVAAFSAGLAPAIVAVAAINANWYGSPLNSGYGSLSEIYSAQNVAPNLARYIRWAFETQLPGLVLAAPGVLIALKRTRPASRPLVAGALVLAGVVLACYLPYAVFEDWFYLRFLLPALPVVVAFAAVALVTFAARLPRAARAPALILSCTALVSLSVRQAHDHDAFAMWRFEGRYITVGRSLASAVPDDAVILTLQHSGSVRFYSGRHTLRWDLLEPQSLDSAIEYLTRHGRPPFILLEAWEEPDFRRRFAGSRLGRLDWPATREWNDVVLVKLYDPRRAGVQPY
jgi:hypothetical protein